MPVRWRQRADRSAGAVSGDPIAGSAVYPVGAASTSAATSRSAAATWSSWPRSSARPPTSTPRTTCARGPAPTATPSSARRRLRGRLRQQGASPHRRLPALREEGLSVDVASGGELHMALHAGFDPARIHMHGNNKSDEEILFAARAGHRPPGARLLRRDRALRRLLDATAAGADPGDPGDQALDPRLHHHRPARLEVRLRARGRARRRGRSSGCSPPTTRPRRAARPHRLADLRARALRAGDRGARRARRRLVQGGQRRRRPRDRLHGRGRAAVDRRLRRRQGARRRRGLRRRPCGSWSSRAARWSPTPASPSTGSAPSRRSRGSAPTSPSTAACPTTCGRCSTAPATRRWSPTAPAADPDTLATIAGMHCESGDVLVRDALLADPAVGDVLVTPATGAYGHAMANNYNGVARPPVVFCRAATRASSSAARPSRT